MKKAEIIIRLKENKDTLEKQFNISRIGLFGSFAAGNENMNSDIDLIYELKPDKNEGLREIYEVENFLTKILHGRKVDLVNSKFINPIVESEIRDKVIYV